MLLRLVLLLVVALSATRAQSVRVYSEFQRVDPFGNIVRADRSASGQDVSPREILSPALIRNGFTCFHVVVSLERAQEFQLFVVQNPENAVELRLFKEGFVRSGNDWIPDTLTPVSLAYTGNFPDPASVVDGQTVVPFWLEMRVRPGAPVERSRVEAQLWADGRWIIYPMEIRVIQPVVPRREPQPRADLPAPDAPADRAALMPLTTFLCSSRQPGRAVEKVATIRSRIRRDAEQDMAIARALELKGNGELAAALLGVIGASDRKAWCANPTVPRELGAEWYLRLRDHIHREASQ